MIFNVDISGTTRIYTLIGQPVEHSLSPFIMNRAFVECDVDAVYAACSVGPGRVVQAVRGLLALGVSGCNVTYPLKEEVLSIADSVAPAAMTIGAANTLHFNDEGIEADNTDAVGSVLALTEIAHVDPAGKKAVIFGAGGAGRAAGYGLLEAGVASVTFAVRDAGKARKGIERLQGPFRQQSVNAVVIGGSGPPTEAAKAIERSDIIINATPVGMTAVEAGTPTLIGEDLLSKRHTCFDFVYHPRATSFLETARARGAAAVDGLAMLIGQAHATFRRWTGCEFSLRDMYNTVSDHLEKEEDDSES
jgi:shikimate dehydrogenase